MTRFLKRYYLSWVVVVAPLSALGDDGVSFNLSAQALQDSNLSRTPTPVSDSLFTTIGSVTANKSFDHHAVNLRWAVQDVKYETRKDLDAVIQEGDLGLQSNWTQRLTSQVNWSRKTHEVDLLEFFEKDVVTQDIANAKLGYGSENRLATYLGWQQIDQHHSNSQRESLNYKEQQGFVESDYHTATRSNIALLFKAGTRTYSQDNINGPVISPTASSVFDFKYQQLELDGSWVLSPKTKLKVLVASFNREGELNNGAGALYSVETLWNPSEKISVSLGYQLNQPAIGELSDTPAREKNTSSSIDWQMTQKLKLGTNLTYIKCIYTVESNSIERNETFYTYSPLQVDYAVFNNMSLRMEVILRSNQSPLIYREYHARQLMLNLTAHF